jgi:hypothetical protein
MNLKLRRTTFTGRSTIGELAVDGAFECFTLEDMVRPVKVPGMTAISEGVYVVSVSFSDRFKRLLPEVHDVPNFTGIRIHPGNTDADTEGCILVGQTADADVIGNSRAAFNKLFPKIQAAAQKEKIFLEVTSVAAEATHGAAAAMKARATPPMRGLAGTSDRPARLDLVRRSSGKSSARPARKRSAPKGRRRNSRPR